jgi:hypothetical protein
MGSQGTVDLGADEPDASSLQRADIEPRLVEITEEQERQLDAESRRSVTRMTGFDQRTMIVMMMVLELCPRCHCADYDDVISRDGQPKRKCCSCHLVYLAPDGQPMDVVAVENEPTES